MLKGKKVFGAFIKNLVDLPLGFKHVLCARILFVNRSIFCIATSFVVVAILTIVMGHKLNI
jgi:hypothetical protein